MDATLVPRRCDMCGMLASSILQIKGKYYCINCVRRRCKRGEHLWAEWDDNTISCELCGEPYKKDWR